MQIFLSFLDKSHLFMHFIWQNSTEENAHRTHWPLLKLVPLKTVRLSRRISFQERRLATGTFQTQFSRPFVRHKWKSIRQLVGVRGRDLWDQLQISPFFLPLWQWGYRGRVRRKQRRCEFKARLSRGCAQPGETERGGPWDRASDRRKRSGVSRKLSDKHAFTSI